MKQLIIARKDLNMSPGKLAAQVSHASMAFLTSQIRAKQRKVLKDGIMRHQCEPEYEYTAELFYDTETAEEWINGSFTKIVCEAKTRTHLLKAVTHAEELGLVEGIDFFLIKDNCYTELTPEETDENGVGRTLTCIGFRPLPDDICTKISRKYQLYK